MKTTKLAVLMVIAAALIGGIAATLKTTHAQVSGNLPTLMTTYAATGRYGSSVQVQCRLTDLNGHAVVGAPIHLYLAYPTYTTNLATSYTDATGYARATFDLRPYDINGTGTYRLAWYYAGNGVYSSPIPGATLTVTR